MSSPFSFAVAAPTHVGPPRNTDRSQQSQIENLLYPVNGVREAQRRAGLKPKNHMSEQRQRLQAMAASKQQVVQEQAVAVERAARQKAIVRQHALLQASRTADAGAEPAVHQPDGERTLGRRPCPPPGRAHEPGRVPAYLQRRKAEKAAQEAEGAARQAYAAACPAGTRLVGPEEKAHVFEKLAAERAKAAHELASLPFVVKTNATQQKKDMLEARLEEIAGAEQAYAKDKVYVPHDM